MPKVEVRFKMNDIPTRLTAISKAKGYKSRDDFLRDVLTAVANEEYESETAFLYRQSLEKVVQGMEGVYNALMLNAELGLMKLPEIDATKVSDEDE